MRFILIFILAFVASSVELAQAKVSQEAVTAARHLRAWQFEKARKEIAALVKANPSSEESRYLQAEIDFYDGRYKQVVSGLVGLKDSDVDGNVGALRKLAASSLQATKTFLVRPSSKGHFQIYYAPGKDAAIVPLVDEVLEAAYEALGDDLGYRPDAPIRVELLGAASDLAKVSTLTVKEIETTGTIALCKYGKLMVVTPRATVFGYPWMDTLTHEYVHYVVTQMSHDTVPVWLHEGLARYLQVRWRGPATGKLGSLDEHLLAKGLRNDKMVSFDDMHPSMAKLPSQEAAALAFAEVSTMVGYIHSKVGDSGLRKVILGVKDGSSARRSVAKVLSKPWKEVERNWLAHLKSSRLQSKRFAERGRQIRFRKGKGSDDNVGVHSIKNEKAKKYTRLAGMLRARGHNAAAAIEYQKALKFAGGSDPLIAAKLSRVYLELGRYQDAIHLAEPLLDIDEMDPVPPTTLGIARLALGDAKMASVAFERALRITPFDSQVRCGLAQAYKQVGDKNTARERDACELLQQVR